MEMGIVTALCAAFCGLCALCCVACLIVMLAGCKAAENPPDRPTDGSPFLGKGGKERDTTEDIERRRRRAVEARQHQNFMEYDGTPQTPIDPNTILADGG